MTDKKKPKKKVEAPDLELRRPNLRDEVWDHVETSLDGYGNMIDRLIAAMPLQSLASFVEGIRNTEEEPARAAS